MGWFWADTATPPRSLAPQSLPSSDAAPPPGCPMHKATSTSPFPPQNSSRSPADASSCPISSPNAPLSPSTAKPSTLSKLNPLNYMPSNLSQSRSTNQTIALPTSRTTSSIPRGDAEANWEYPSPQQMYNAMLRKGYDDTPEDAVESMVAVHNFLNEGAWAEIEGWEARFSKGLGYGWQACSRGEEGFQDMPQWKGDRPRLMRFMGRPGDLTPKARMIEVLGRVWPSKFASELPFDRHDWYVQRTTPGGQTREVRYVIDYYSGPPEPTGEPVFYLDVRPAVDGPTAAAERMLRWGGDVWHRASGAKAREMRHEG
ncbi:hypothetical protein HO173_008010 [Letharia columbiana]|uniref:Holocytochrome c-type synthase n=1 Tax=Letharia columbiana TaxID=112416 RepID=A0A8H6L345_9LECA|nr:uncharacterized protein HO173_008010 [Letharia columbiana]KAF6233798.1 hypothetical protein HO173_008010 [Letharia columbiana]